MIVVVGRSQCSFGCLFVGWGSDSMMMLFVVWVGVVLVSI